MAAGFKWGEKETNSYGVKQAQVLGSYQLATILKYSYYRSGIVGFLLSMSFSLFLLPNGAHVTCRKLTDPQIQETIATGIN